MSDPPALEGRRTPDRNNPVRRNEETPTVKNRITPYEAGWLTMLVKQGIATEAGAREAMNRVAQAALDEINRLRAKKRAGKRRKNQ